jgi:hypothetical protein
LSHELHICTGFLKKKFQTEEGLHTDYRYTKSTFNFKCIAIRTSKSEPHSSAISVKYSFSHSSPPPGKNLRSSTTEIFVSHLILRNYFSSINYKNYLTHLYTFLHRSNAFSSVSVLLFSTVLISSLHYHYASGASILHSSFIINFIKLPRSEAIT